MVNNAKVTHGDISVTNGVIHIIDTFLQPSNLTSNPHAVIGWWYDYVNWIILFKKKWLFRQKNTGICSFSAAVRTGAVTRYDFPSNISLRYAFGKNLMMWTQNSNKKIVSKSIGVLFPSTIGVLFPPTVWWESYRENGKQNSIRF
jgi:hypothetical protein